MITFICISQPLHLVRLSRVGLNSLVFIPGTELLLCSFHDGSVGVFNMVTRQMKFQGLPGHTETIFDVRFRPSDPTILATASFDSSIKVTNDRCVWGCV
jgi:WD40 repeat protein